MSINGVSVVSDCSPFAFPNTLDINGSSSFSVNAGKKGNKLPNFLKNAPTHIV